MGVNYDQIRIKYFDLVEENIDLLKEPMYTRQGIEEKIILVTRNPKKAENYVIEIVDGQNKLYIKSNSHTISKTTASQEQHLEVLPVEDAFDVLLDAHITCNHGNATTTYQKLAKKYSVPIFCASWIVESCNVCNSNQVDNQNSVETQIDQKVLTRGLWRLNIIRDESLALNSIRVTFLLILKEDVTNFVILRPIFESCEALGLDLMKLFTEFGYPEKVFVPNMITFYKKILDMVHSIYPAVNVPVEEVSHLNNVFEEDKKEVLNEIKNWMDMMQDSYWEQCCHIVQYKLNTTEKPFTRLFSNEQFIGIPFNEFFNYGFRTRMTWITPPYLKKPVTSTAKK